LDLDVSYNDELDIQLEVMHEIVTDESLVNETHE